MSRNKVSHDSVRRVGDGRRVNGTYVAALLAMGIAAGARGGWGQSQGVVPVNVSGQSPSAPSAASPAIAPPGGGAPSAAAPAIPVQTNTPVAPAAPVQGSTAQATPTVPATQGVVPVNVTPP